MACRKCPEGSDVEVDGVLKGTHTQFVIVSRIEHVNQFPGIEHGLEGLRLDFLTGEVRRSNVVKTNMISFFFRMFIRLKGW